MKKTQLLSESTQMVDHLKITTGNFERTTKSGEIKQFSRSKIDRVDAAAVLVWNKDREQFILTKQLRYPVMHKVENYLLEIVAGKVDDGEDVSTTAFREVEEEIGYRIPENQLKQLYSFFASPGYSSEKYHLFYAEVSDADQVNAGGGLEEENEQIELVYLSKKEFLAYFERNEIDDAKTLVAAMWLNNQ